MRDFYRGKKVLITGHTGFKGAWMCHVLTGMGAEVTGYALKPPTSPSLFQISGIAEKIRSVEGDIRDLAHLREVFAQATPEIVIHMAAQPIVREAYEKPVYTYDVNVMGTVNVLECARMTDSVKSVINVTTDKVYRNYEREQGYREDEELNGYDPYSNSKSCSELVTDSYRNSFLRDKGVAVSTMRAGNVIGGGDFARDRIVPDCVRAACAGEKIIIRNPASVRPFQHVLEPVMVYLQMAKAQMEDPSIAGCYNVGPNVSDCRTTEELVRFFCDAWEKATGKVVEWQVIPDGGPHEAGFLKLDCTKLKQTLKWEPVLDLESAIHLVVEWTKCYAENGDLAECMEKQIERFWRSCDTGVSCKR